MNIEALEKRAAYNRRLNVRGFRWARLKGWVILPNGSEADKDILPYVAACAVLDEWEARWPDLSYDEYTKASDKAKEERDGGKLVGFFMECRHCGYLSGTRDNETCPTRYEECPLRRDRQGIR